MANLCVNIDHIATLRQARLDREPDPVAAAVLVEQAGAHGITVHLREDRRHIQDRDVRLLKDIIKTKLNLEMAATDEMISLACELFPDECTLVPENREELTTEGGLNVVSQQERLTKTVNILKDAGIIVSLFVDPNKDQITAAAKTGAQFVELHTGHYARVWGTSQAEDVLEELEQASLWAAEQGLAVNAGHGLTYRNVEPIADLTGIVDLNIGHNIIARAALVGLEQAVRDMLGLVV